jgi:hypothetical protein
MMSACIVAAQAVMLPIALVVGRTADSWGRKPLFLAGFTILPVRAVLYTLSDNSFWLVGVQLLDGVGAGVFGALTPPGNRRYHARHRSLQPCLGCYRNNAGDRRLAEWPSCWRDRRSLRLHRDISRARRRRPRRRDRLRHLDARNR